MSLGLMSRRLGVVFVLVGLSACASTSATRPSQQLNALYGQLDQSSKDYETALQQARAGNQLKAQKTLDGALGRLKNAAARCSQATGCDPQRFLAVYDRLLRLKDASSVGDEGLETAGEMPSPDMAAGPNGLPQAQRSVTLLRGQKLSELIAMNSQVKAALELWLTQRRPYLIDTWINYQFLRHEMWPQYQKADLPEALLFGIMAQESGGKVHAVSRSGAAGPLQFMYATGIRFGLSSQSGFDTRFDPIQSARANAEYLNQQLEIFNNNLEDTLAAYNGGEGRMRRLVGDKTSTSFYDPSIYNQLSQETRDYVPSVLAAAWLFLHPDSYNLHFPRIDREPGKILLKRPASLAELTVCLGGADGMDRGWFRTLRNLNPRLNPNETQTVGQPIALPKPLEAAYRSRCVDGPWPILASDLHRAAVPAQLAPAPAVIKPPGTRRYRVRRGETLISIVRKLRCSSVKAIAEMNHLERAQIHPGQVLTVPECR